jgi:hypothetical protein
LNIAKITAISTQRGINQPDAPLIFGVETDTGGFRPIKVPDHELVRFLNAREANELSKNNPPPVPRVIAIDFDGTLCQHQFPTIGEPQIGVKEAVERLKALGFYILIWSCRTSHWNYEVFGGDPSIHPFERPHVKAMKDWLDANGIPYDEIDDGSRGKPLADFYIDDKAVRFDENTNWFTIANNVERYVLDRAAK